MSGRVPHPLLTLTLALVVLAVGACAPAAVDPLAGEYVVKGGGAPLKVFQVLSDAFSRKHPGVSFRFEDIGSVPGMTLVASREADLGTSSAEPPANLRDQVAVVSVGISGTAIVVGAGNPVGGLTRDQARAIFSGEITDWVRVGAPAGRIIVAIRPKGSAIRRSFENYIFEGMTPTFAKGAFEVNDIDETINAVGGRSDVIAMITVNDATLSDTRLKLLALDGVRPTKENLISGAYPMRRPLYLVYSKSGTKPGITAFLEFVRGPEGQRLIASAAASG